MEANQLTRSDLFTAMSAEEVEELLALCDRRELSEDEFLFTEHDIGDELYIVESGTIRISKAISLEADHTLGVVERGGLIGEMAVVANTYRSASARAQCDSVVLAMDGDKFQDLVQNNPSMGLKILKGLTLTIAERLRVTNNLLSETVAWGLEISGAAGMSFQKLMTESADIRVSLLTGRTVTGRLVHVEKNDGRYEIMVRDPMETVHIIPYHAILEMTFGLDVLTAQPHDEAEEV